MACRGIVWFGFLGAVFASASASGCGLLVSGDIADFTVRLPEKAITVDSAQWGLPADASFPTVECNVVATACSTGASAVCGEQNEGDGAVCFGVCTEGVCHATVVVQLFNRMELDKEVPELSRLDKAPLGSLEVNRIFYTVSENTFGVETPPLTVYVGGQGVMTIGDPGAVEVGTLAAIPAGTTVEDGAIEFIEGGKEALEERLRSYTTPFNVLVGGSIELDPGDPIPAGRLVAVVQVEATAGL